jgi:hypothetical protein
MTFMSSKHDGQRRVETGESRVVERVSLLPFHVVWRSTATDL